MVVPKKEEIYRFWTTKNFQIELPSLKVFWRLILIT